MTPHSETDLAQIITDASGPLRVVGANTRGFAGHIIGETLSTTGLSGITRYEPGALTLVAKSGTPVAEIEAALTAEGQMLAFEPMDHRTILGTRGEPTIGGVVAANVSGPRRISAVGACRDSLLGVRFVDGSGNIIKNGGRVMKNVTGYDLVKLMAGSYGTLGVLTEVSLKVLPLPAASATLTVWDLSPNKAVPAMTAALGTPFEVTGTAFGPYHDEAPNKLHIRVEGSAESVSYRADALAKLLGPFGKVQIDKDRDANRAVWLNIRDMTHLAGQSFIARTSIKPSDAAKFLEDSGLASFNRTDLDWSGGLIWSSANDDALIKNGSLTGQPAQSDLRIDGAEMLLGKLQRAVGRLGGHTTLLKGPAGMKNISRFQPQPAPIEALQSALRAKFDPRRLFNQGIMS